MFPMTNEESTENITLSHRERDAFNTSCAQLSNTRYEYNIVKLQLQSDPCSFSYRAAYGSPVLVYGMSSDGSIGSQSVMANVTVETEMDSFPCPLLSGQSSNSAVIHCSLHVYTFCVYSSPTVADGGENVLSTGTYFVTDLCMASPKLLLYPLYIGGIVGIVIASFAGLIIILVVSCIIVCAVLVPSKGLNFKVPRGTKVSLNFTFRTSYYMHIHATFYTLILTEISR